jgi:hypothetical protein
MPRRMLMTPTARRLSLELVQELKQAAIADRLDREQAQIAFSVLFGSIWNDCEANVLPCLPRPRLDKPKTEYRRARRED